MIMHIDQEVLLSTWVRSEIRDKHREQWLRSFPEALAYLLKGNQRSSRAALPPKCCYSPCLLHLSGIQSALAWSRRLFFHWENCDLISKAIMNVKCSEYEHFSLSLSILFFILTAETWLWTKRLPKPKVFYFTFSKSPKCNEEIFVQA